jgi:hypothetical protein
MPKSSGRPSALTRILEEKLREYEKHKREVEEVKSQLYLTPEKETSGEKFVTYRDNQIELNNSPALERAIKRQNLQDLFYPKGNNTYTVPGYDPRNRSGEDYYLKKLIEKVLPEKYRTSLRHLQLKSKLRNLQVSQPEKPTYKSVMIMRRGLGR